MDGRELIGSLEEKARKAREIAEEYGEIIGWVSRTSPSIISEEGGIVVFDIDPEIYFGFFEELGSAGSYLAVVDIKSLNIVSLRIISVERRDILAELDLPDLSVSSPGKDLYGLLTRTRVKAKPLLSYDPFNDVVSIANYVIEPQSPVIRPLNEKVIQKILGLPTSGVFIGYPTVGDKPIFDLKAHLFIPLKAYYQHMIVLGTTGSGKTTLLKNMISSLASGYKLSDNRISLVVMDPNRDYVTLPLKPHYEFSEGLDVELEEKMISNIKGRVDKPNGLVLIIPITSMVLERLNVKDTSWAKALMDIADEYFESTYKSIAEKMGWKTSIIDKHVYEEPGDNNGKPLRFVDYKVSIVYEDNSRDIIELFIIPYGFRFNELSVKEFISLNPYFTRNAKDSLSRLLNYLNSRGVVIESLQELYDALREARYRIDERRGQKQNKPSITNPRINLIVDLIKDLAVHKSTLENMMRQIGSLIDTGLFDLEIPGGRGADKYLREPPINSILEKHFSLFKGYPIVVDLEYLQENTFTDPEKVISIAAFRILNNIFHWKLERTRMRITTQPVLILIDEAHRFFPSRGGGREEYIEHISSMIDRIARLGRARRLGLIFSTHSPRDVHDIILQLANTKIILRMDKSQVSSLDIPSEYRELVLRAGDRVGVVKSHTLRIGYMSFRTPLPLAGHYDLSALSFP